MVAGVYEVLAVDGLGGEVLERGPSCLGLSEGLRRGPLVGGRELAGLSRGRRSQESNSCRRQAKVGSETHGCCELKEVGVEEKGVALV